MKAKRHKGWFECAYCPIETDSGYEIAPGVIVCERCYRKSRKKNGTKIRKVG